MDLDELYRLLRSSHVRATGIVDTLRDPLLVLGPDMTVISANPAFYRAFEASADETVGRSFTALGDGQWDIDELNQLLREVVPKSASIYDYEVTADFPHVGSKTMLITAQRVEHPDRHHRILLVSIVDATLRRRKEAEKDILIGEFDHRIKNLMSVTRALARQTSVKDRSAVEYRDDLISRLDALGRSLQIAAHRDTTSLTELTEQMIEPYRDGASRIEVVPGPQVPLLPTQAMSLGMVLHELATNALKYGALSGDGGQVSIGWTPEDDPDGMPMVRLHWNESGGPETAPPDSQGFGTKLIEVSMEHELGGQARLDFRPEGLRAELTFPQHG
ncbi:histidine kinase [Paracoccus liaowanqingii]|uniref:histidine kinase n=1 Tax=Paracoccus liaowanqingii TaxID=2560053 RepID=A0A4Z1CQ15_9RHOB|nr:HWE histidine kinase domain-containing protein [Paracoccus liaowanqingii]TGN67097.1 histidine kinase [Paracoccus liaowanqingii]